MTIRAQGNRKRLLFVSPQFLFPLDAGGKIRSANILKNLKGGAFEIDLVSPAGKDDAAQWRGDIEKICDRFAAWPEPPGGAAKAVRRAGAFMSSLPVSVAGDISAAARRVVREGLARNPDLVVFDYAHSRALAPRSIDVNSLIFAHNVETEIFERQRRRASGAMALAWAREAAKMARFERRAIMSTDGVIAVSARDAAAFENEFGARFVRDIPTGVDLDYFTYQAPQAEDAPRVVFTGSMDWRPNQDGLLWFMEEIWPAVLQKAPKAQFIVVGKNPPPAMVAKARAKKINWRFTGFVEDVRDHARGAVFVIPLRIGGGTRIKAFEAMAMGVPVVSTSLGVEGLPVEADKHCLVANQADGFAAAVLALLKNAERGRTIADAARKMVEASCSQARVAAVFERRCLELLDERPLPMRA